MLWVVFFPFLLAEKRENLRSLFLSLASLAELGPVLAGESDFGETSHTLLGILMEAAQAQQGVLFGFEEMPSLLGALASKGFSSFPEDVAIPLLPQNIALLVTTPFAHLLTPEISESYLGTSTGLPPEIFKCIVPLRVRSRLVGLAALGRHIGGSPYSDDDLGALGTLAPYVGLAIENHVMSQTLKTRVSENLRLLSSFQTFQGHTLEAFASAIDIKDFHTKGHSLRVGRYGAGIAEALGMGENGISEMRSTGYLHDVGKVFVDKYLFKKSSPLESDEFQEMADHTVIGHEIVQGIEFPWPSVAKVVRSHHERADGSGYPDGLRNDEVPMAVRISAVADTFDAMLSRRPYREALPVGDVITEIVQLTPQKFDVDVVQALLLQLRRDAAGRVRIPRPGGKTDLVRIEKPRFLDEGVNCYMSPSDIDNLAATLSHKINRGKTYFA